MEPGLFDLVIIDEASQCTVPAVLPLLCRAKRALIVGDPQQLAQVVTLPDEDCRSCERRVSLRNGWLVRRRLDYRSHSAYDAFRFAVDQPALLDEHYRSHPAIIDVANRHFYGGQLTVLTPPERLQQIGPPPLEWVDVAGEVQRRGQTICNEQEAAKVAETVARLDDELPEQVRVDGDTQPVTIGVVTPFRGQRQLLEQRLHPVRACRNLRVGTAHAFQDDERDVMVLSPVGAPDIQPSTLR